MRGHLEAMQTLDHALDVAESLALEDQEALVDLLKKRMAARRRAQLIADVKASRKEHKSGKLKPSPVADIMAAIRS